jgi:hypothetical protein
MEKIYLDLEGTDLFQPLPTKVNMVLASIRVEADKAISHYCNIVGREFESPYINTTLYQMDKFSTFMENITTINKSYFRALLSVPVSFLGSYDVSGGLLLHTRLDINTHSRDPEASSYVQGLYIEYGLGAVRAIIYMLYEDNRFSYHSISTIARSGRLPLNLDISISTEYIKKLESCLNN